MPERLRSLTKILLAVLSAVIILIIVFMLLARSGYEWWATAVEFVDVRRAYYAGATLEDVDVHQKAAAALSRGQLPEIGQMFTPRSQDRIASGDGLVLTIRKHIDRPLTLVPVLPDYEYVTVYIPDFVLSQQSFDLGGAAGDRQIIAVYASGLRNHYDLACIGYARSGMVSVALLPDDRIDVRGRLRLMPNRLVTPRLLPCEPTEVNISGVFEKAEPSG